MVKLKINSQKMKLDYNQKLIHKKMKKILVLNKILNFKMTYNK